MLACVTSVYCAAFSLVPSAVFALALGAHSVDVSFVDTSFAHAAARIDAQAGADLENPGLPGAEERSEEREGSDDDEDQDDDLDDDDAHAQADSDSLRGLTPQLPAFGRSAAHARIASSHHCLDPRPPRHS